MKHKSHNYRTPKVEETYSIAIRKRIEEFRNSEDEKIIFPSTLSSEERMYVHKISKQYGMISKSFGSGASRYLTLRKNTGDVLLDDALQLDLNIAATRILNEIFENEPVLESEISLLLKSVHESSANAGVESETDEKVLIAVKDKNIIQSNNKKTNSYHNISNNKNDNNKSNIRHHSILRPITLPATQLIEVPGKILKQKQSLPIYAHREEILNAIDTNDVVIISGETGSGKSTQVVQYLLEDDPNSVIVCTQPRRLSAISLAERVSEELGDEDVGKRVGYAVRLESSSSRETRITYCTTGVVLSSLKGGIQHSNLLCHATHLIIDEVHERDKNADFLLIFVRELLRQQTSYTNGGKRLKLILMSATMSMEKFRQYFTMNNETIKCSIVSVEGSLFPVKAYFLENILAETNYLSNKSSSILGSNQGSKSKKINNQSNEEEVLETISKLNQSFRCKMCGLATFQNAELFGVHASTCTGVFAKSEKEMNQSKYYNVWDEDDDDDDEALNQTNLSMMSNPGNFGYDENVLFDLNESNLKNSDEELNFHIYKNSESDSMSENEMPLKQVSEDELIRFVFKVYLYLWNEEHFYLFVSIV